MQRGELGWMWIEYNGMGHDGMGMGWNRMGHNVTGQDGTEWNILA